MSLKSQGDVNNHRQFAHNSSGTTANTQEENKESLLNNSFNVSYLLFVVLVCLLLCDRVQAPSRFVCRFVSMFEIVSNLSCVPFGVQRVIVAAKWLRNEYYDEKSPQFTFEKNGRRTEQSQADHKVRGPKASSSWNHRLNSTKAQNKKEFSLRLGHLFLFLQLFFCSQFVQIPVKHVTLCFLL